MGFPPVFLFERLSNDQIKKIMDITQEASMETGQILCREEEEAKAVFIIKTGSVELVTHVENNIELPVAVLRKVGDIFGSGVLVLPFRYSLTARCLESGTLYVIDGSELQKLMNSDRDLGCIIMTNLAMFYLKRLKESRREIKIHFNTLLKTYC
jgi:CRP-like cAMP-binding protein